MRVLVACEFSGVVRDAFAKKGAIDPVGGGTVKLTPDHVTLHSLHPNTDVADPAKWLALCGRHQVMKKNYWDGATGKLNILGILQNTSKSQKEEALTFLLAYFGLQAIEANKNEGEK